MNFKNFLNIPEIEVKGFIKKINDKKNPIEIQIDDGTNNGTKILLSPSEFRRFNKIKKIEKGAKLSIFMQKNANYGGKGPFQISRIS